MIVFPLVAIALAVGYFFSKRAIVRRGLRKVKQKRIGEFNDGDSGRVTGRVIFAGETLVAPLSKRKCVYYHVVVEQYRSGKGGGAWHTILEEKKEGDVVVRDGTHYAIIDTRHMQSYLIDDANYESGSFNGATSFLGQFLSERGIAGTNWLGFDKKLRYKEGVLAEGELFTVSGEGYWNETKDHNLDLPAPQVLVITTGKKEHDVYLSDDPEIVAESGS